MTTVKMPFLAARGAVFPIHGIQARDIRGTAIDIDCFEKAEQWSNGDIFLIEREFAVRVDHRTVQFVARAGSVAP